MYVIFGRLKNGHLSGPVRKFGLLLRAPDLPCKYIAAKSLGFAGNYDSDTGLAYGPAWRVLTGGAFLYGSLDKNSGRFSGDNIAYVYPDYETVLMGQFDEYGSLGRGDETTSFCLTQQHYLVWPELEAFNSAFELQVGLCLFQ